MLGIPGAGKTFFSRQFAQEYGAIHLNFNKIKDVVFGNVEIDSHDEKKIHDLMLMMCEDYLKCSMSVIFDAPLLTMASRRALREQTRSKDLEHLIIWVQTDADTAFERSANRDRRQIDDRYSTSISDENFDAKVAKFQRPQHEEYVVISGKHVYNTQSRAVKPKLAELGITETVAPKPELTKVLPTPTINTSRRRIQPQRRAKIISRRQRKVI